MKIVIIDNFDSFTYNLVHYIEEITSFIPDVVRNDIDDIELLDQYDCFVLSPGPGLPNNAGKLMSIIEAYSTKKRILGVCLGHQAIGEYYGGKLKNLHNVQHGESTPIVKKGDSALYHSLNEPILVGRYHSWVIDSQTMPFDLKITSIDESGEIMSFEHTTLPIVGIQYHPESILTPNGKIILSNFFSNFLQK